MQTLWAASVKRVLEYISDWRTNCWLILLYSSGIIRIRT